jgi:hypothetical protein
MSKIVCGIAKGIDYFLWLVSLGPLWSFLTRPPKKFAICLTLSSFFSVVNSHIVVDNATDVVSDVFGPPRRRAGHPELLKTPSWMPTDVVPTIYHILQWARDQDPSGLVLGS